VLFSRYLLEDVVGIHVAAKLCLPIKLKGR